MTPLANQLQALVARSDKLKRWGLGLSLAAAATGCLGSLLNWLGKTASPDVLKMPHVPDKLLELFGKAASNQAAGAGFDPVEATLVSMTETFAGMGAVVVSIGIVLVGYRMVFRGDLFTNVAPLFWGSILVGGATILAGGFLMTDEATPKTPKSREQSPRAAFVAAVEDKDFKAVSKALQQVGQDTTPQGLYVLAQVALQEGEPAKPPVSAADAEKIGAAAADFGAKPHALYSIERAAFGAPRSAASIAYRDESQRAGQVLTGAARISSGLCAGFLILTAGVTVLSTTIRRRLTRIADLRAIATAEGSKP